MTGRQEASDAVRRRLLKILELAKRGEGGEKETAERMLAKLMNRHGITLEDLEKPERQRYEFTVRDQEDHRILMQVAYRVLNTADFPHWTIKSKKRKRWLELDAMQFAEIHFLYDLYRRQWTKERDALLRAFFQKHELFGTPSEDKTPSTLSADELERLRRMMRGLEEVHEHKPLEHTGAKS